MSNQGPFTRTALTSYFVAASGVAVGLIFADMLDRYLSTMKPGDSAVAVGGTAAAGQRPWFGRNAAAAQRRRPDALRLGGQALGAVISMGGAYFARNMRIVPWLLGGAAVGFGANLGKMLWDWWLAPMVLKVDPAKPLSFANRMYVLEQRDVQDTIEGLFENWNSVPALAANQTAAEPTTIPGPLVSQAPGVPADMYALGRPRGYPQMPRYAQPRGPAQNPSCVGKAEFTPTGRVGECSYCGGLSGCNCGCPWLNYVTAGAPPYTQACQIVWPAGLTVGQLATATGTTVETILQMNGFTSPEQVVAGMPISLPLVACTYAQTVANGNGTTVVTDVPPNGGMPPAMVNPAMANPMAMITPSVQAFAGPYGVAPGSTLVTSPFEVRGAPDQVGNAPDDDPELAGRAMMAQFSNGG